MNILYLSWRGPGHPNSGGAELVAHEHAKAWIKKGHKVTLFTSYFPGAKEVEYIDRVKIIRAGNAILTVQLKAFIWYLFKSKEKFDVVIDEFHGLPFFTPLYVRAKKLAWIHEIAGNVWKFNSLPFPFNSLVANLAPVCEPLIFKLFYKKTKFVTFADSIKNELIDICIPEKNITIINHGVNILNPKKISKNKMFTISYLGVLTQDKGIEDAIDAINLLNKIQKIQFWIIGQGEGSYTKFLKSKVEALGLDKVTKFWGFVNEQKKFKLLKKASVLIHPSIREGWGLVVIEAGLMGTPTIGYNVSGLRDSIIDMETGLLCKYNNPKNLSENIFKLYQDKKLYKKLSQNSIKWSKNFSWGKSTCQSLDIINKL